MEKFQIISDRPAGGALDLTGNAALLTRVNSVRLLNHLRLHGPASRADLARRTGLDAKTITNLANRLVRDGLVRAEEAVAAGRGRPAERLALNPEAAFGLGMDIGASQVSAALLDFGGGVRASSHRAFPGAQPKRTLVAAAVAEAAGLLKDLDARQRRAVAGLGVCVPGLVDRARGVVRSSVNIRGFRDTPLVERLRARFGLPVLLEESSRSMALAEVWFGGNDAPRDFICMDLGFGIGMGIVHDGRLYRGAHEMSGEIGHTVVQPGGARCTCGKRGCLETVAGGRALGALARRLPLKRRGVASHGVKAVCEAAVAGDPRAAKAIREAGRCIGIAVANVISLFDPGRVVLNGGLVKAGPLLIEPLREAVRAHAVGPYGHRCTVEVSRLGEPAGALGAAMLPLRAFFEFDNIRL